ncbi:MAG TPA: DUF1499 domain-containing protein [Thermoanaerobaculia bacterium]|nr:DUF1499 domain-containing protein [Thermoanaerobaculia bacterium]
MTSARRTPALAPCPDTPNCVSTEATQAARRMEPIPFAGEPELAIGRLVRIVEAMPGGAVKRREPGYLHATFTSRLLRYVDDVDLLVDPAARVIRFRSASRVGTWDLGANRRRMREIRRRFLGDG